MAALDHEDLQQKLRKRRVCRFCLCAETGKLTSIYIRDTRVKASAPLPIQIMAIASIEVFSNDGMPSFVCTDCTAVFEFSYQFKQMCKKADNFLRQYPFTGKWPPALERPKLSLHNSLHASTAQYNSNKTETQGKKFILNATPSSAPEPPQRLPTKVEKDEDFNTASLFSKIENNDELSLDDIQQLVAAEDIEEAEFESTERFPVVLVDSGNKTRPKLLNKASVRILNKDANSDKEPRLSLPKIKQDNDGNMEVVAEILDENAPFETEPDPKIAEVIDTNVYPCPDCDRTFPLLQLRDIHLKNHTRDRLFQCDDCGKSFFSKYDLQRHSYTHNGAKPFQCSACDRAFSRASLLQRHEKTHTDVPKYICVTCERAFISKETMEKHAERHKIVRPFQCKICNKGFAFKQGLERHEVIHSRQQPFPCQYCNLSFSTSMKLSRHLTAHAGGRPYPCKYCKKSYLLSHHLTRHLRSHTNATASGASTVVSFMCSRCEQSFPNRDDLIRHSTTHADEQNLSCPLCKESFESIENLTDHIREHSDGDAFACEFCDLIFMFSEKLQSHIDNEHAQEMEAYFEDDRAQAERQRKNRHDEMENSDESLQTTVDEILEDDNNQKHRTTPNLAKAIKQERGSPKIISQIVVSPANKEKTSDDNSLLIPLKQIKLEGDDKKVQARPTMASKPPQGSPQLKRKAPGIANQPSRDKNQPSIQSMLKLPKGITVKKTAISPDKPQEEKVAQAPTIAPSKNNQNVVDMKIGDKKVKVQKIRVTKAQAAAMAKEGRIKIKDGQIILTQDHK